MPQEVASEIISFIFDLVVGCFLNNSCDIIIGICAQDYFCGRGTMYDPIMLEIFIFEPIFI